MLDARYETPLKLYPYTRSADQDADQPARHPVVIVGGGPVGLVLALDLGLRGVPALVLDDHDGVGIGSRAICFAKRTLEIAHRLGCAAEMVEKGVVWNVGKVFHGERQIYEFNLQPEEGHRHPAFINLQQYYFERFLVNRIRQAQKTGAPIDIRGRNRVTAFAQDNTTLTVETPEGPYTLQADWVIACDGARSPLRQMLGLGFEGRVFEDNFLIADVRMAAEFPTERWFWFEPPFEGAGQSALLHKQPDDVWRIDFQLGWDIDREVELAEHKVRARVNAMLGPGVDYELEWTSIYTFQCRRMDRFRHGNVLFAGDAAHQVSPFGARGANSGVQDADNLGWKLAAVLNGEASTSLLDSYEVERMYAADENILNSTRATDFLTPKSEMSHIFRNAVLELARDHPFARPLVNSGRLSVPTVYDDLPLNGPDDLPGAPDASRVGAACPDAPLGNGFLLDQIGGQCALIALDTDVPAMDGLGVTVLRVDTVTAPLLRDRLLGDAATGVYLVRPDQHIAARWSSVDRAAVAQALATVMGRAA
ncbi:MAG: FAD-dependent oxidoreductase [Pseudomonadota bacterium]